ncbi:MAG: hypothetical protein FWH55_05435 [Oscillospiraceae bacterium]|nr:hypothetical protein [Oscillospiraceae bacterium]
MPKTVAKKELTDFDVKRKAVKLVISHLKKKLPKEDFDGSDGIVNWIEEFEIMLEKPEFVMIEYYSMRRELNDIIERTVDDELRNKLRDSWYSLGKALDKKLKRN